jgi:glycosyltransferase involved in cell wall biosynthesis
MNILFVHNNFPAQYRYLVRALLREADMALAAVASPSARSIKGVRLVKYAMPGTDVSATHPFARRFDLECRRAEQVLYSLTSLVGSGFVPDVILAHPGWGETLPLRTVFPKARLLLYCEFFYGTSGGELGFDPEFPDSGLDGHVNLHVKNAATVLALADCDCGISPTRWQHSTFPAQFRAKIDVIHEGVDVDIVKPARRATLRLPSGQSFTESDEVITFAARNLEPLRGYHVFMRALPRILEQRPAAHAVIIGADGSAYGLQAPKGTTWKSVYLREIADRIDMSRVHFAGSLPYPQYLAALQVSAAHVYLTYPFVLSWSLLEAMSAGCAVIASDTPPVAEVIDADNGLLVPFFDVAALAERVIEVLANPRRFLPMRAKARQLVIEKYDAERICIPKMMALVRGTEAAPSAGPPETVAAAPIKRHPAGKGQSGDAKKPVSPPKAASAAT